MSFLAVTIPVSLLIAAIMLVFVIRAARAGQFDDWEGPAARHLFDDDATPEVDGGVPASIDGSESLGQHSAGEDIGKEV